jgi:hypothetical protein
MFLIRYAEFCWNCTQWSCKTILEMEDIAVSVSKYHVVSCVPDFQTKPADSQATRRAEICRFVVRWKI